MRHDGVPGRWRRAIVGGVLVTVITWACGVAVGKHAEPSDYDQSCTTNADCVAVWQQSCDDPGCNCTPAGAVNKNDAERFRADEARVRCTPLPPGAPVAMCDCVGFEAFCSGGTCATRAMTFGTDGGP